MATKVNIFADQGSDYNLDLTVKDDDGSVLTYQLSLQMLVSKKVMVLPKHIFLLQKY